MVLAVGDIAPNFSLFSDEGKQVSLSDFSGKKLVLYFYPKDNTPGCTVEANDFAKLHSAFKAQNVAIIGVSKDSVSTHKRFRGKQELPFNLLSDDEATVCEAYGVHVPRTSLLGKKCIQRSTFLIDEEGVIEAIWPKVKVNGHAQAVLNMLVNVKA